MARMTIEESYNKRLAWREKRKKIMRNTEAGAYKTMGVGQISHSPRYTPCKLKSKDEENNKSKGRDTV